MCGLVGRLGPPAAVDLGPALRALAHRGPDGEGRWQSPDGRLALGHARLAVVARSANAQPVRGPGGVAAALNGELYGWRAQAAALRARGHAVGEGDAALLPALYAEHGAGLGPALRGEFALAVADPGHRSLVLLRDPFGVKPLLWAHFGGALWFASEAAALFALGLPRALCPRALAHAFAHQYLPPDRTPFAGLRALPPGGRLRARLDAGDRLQLDVDAWAPLRWPAPAEAPAAPTPAELGAALDAAVGLRLDAEVPLAVHLGGGVDGAAVLESAARQGARLPAFTLRFPGPAHDEGPAAAATASALGCPHTEVMADEDTLLDALPAAVRAAGALCINGQLPARWLLDRAVRAAGAVVVLSGEGSDELGLGYPHLVQDAGGQSPGAAAQRGVMLPPSDDPEAGEPSLEAVYIRLGFIPTFLRAKAGLGRVLSPLLRPGASAAALDGDEPLAALLDGLQPELQAATAGRPPAQVSAWLWTRLCLGGYILRDIGDAQEMAHGLEGRPPFLDPAVWAVLRRAPVGAQLGPSGGKALLRRHLDGRLPPDIVRRPKHPFLAPPLLRGPRAARARGWLDRGLDALPLVDPDRARAWWRATLERGDPGPREDAAGFLLLSAALLAADGAPAG